jgi:hypothetical protein
MIIAALPLRAAATRKERFTLVEPLMEFPSFFVPLDARI